MTKVIEKPQTQEELIADLQTQVLELKEKEALRSRPFWQKLNHWRKSLFEKGKIVELKQVEVPKSHSKLKKEIKPEFWTKKKIIACSALTILGLGGIGIVKDYLKVENQNVRTANEVIQSSFGDSRSVDGLSERIEKGNLGQFSDSETKSKVAKEFREQMKVLLNSKQPLTAPQIQSSIPEALNASLKTEASISGIDPNLQNPKATKSFVQNNSSTLAAEYWRDKLNQTPNTQVNKFQEAKKVLAAKLQKIKEQYSNLPNIKLTNPKISMDLMRALKFDQQNGVITDLHLVNNTIYIGSKPVHKIPPNEVVSFRKVAGRGEEDKNFNFEFGGTKYQVKGSVVQPKYNNKQFTIPKNIATIPDKPKPYKL